MRKLNKVELEIGGKTFLHQGMEIRQPAAVVVIETEDDELLKQLIGALSQVEDLEV